LAGFPAASRHGANAEPPALRIEETNDEDGKMSIRQSRIVLCRLAMLLSAVLLPAVVCAQTCASGQVCTATFGGQVFTIIGPCNLSSLTSISSCLVINIQPVPIPPPQNASCNDSLFVCGAPTAIVQDFNQTATQPLEQEAKTNIAALRAISNDTLNDFWSRGEIRAYMYLRLLQMANSTTSLSAQDQAVFNYYTQAVNNQRLTIANQALNLYNQWHASPCGFQVPVGPDPNSYIESVSSTCSLPPNSPACLLGQCVPAPPSADQFTGWATGMVLQSAINAWGQLLYSESGITFPPETTTVITVNKNSSGNNSTTTNTITQTPLQVAQGTAAYEYDAVFGSIAEGVGFLTAKHSEIAGIPSNVQTAVETDLQGIWLDALNDVAGDQFRDVVKTALQSVFQAGTESGNEATLAQTFNVETPFSAFEEVAAEDAASLVAESWDTFVGPGVAAAAVIAFQLYQTIVNGEVLTQLQAGLCDASGGQQYSGTCSRTSPETLTNYASDATGRSLILDAFIRSTMPDFSATRLGSSYGKPPAAGPVSSTDPSFIEGSATTPEGSFKSTDWNGNIDSTSVAKGWFVQSATVNLLPSQLTYIPSVAYRGPVCSNPPCGTELWRAWLDGGKFLAQREMVDAGSGVVQDATNTCPSILLPTSNVDLGPICVIGPFTFPIQAGDEVSIAGQIRTVAGVQPSSGTVTSFTTTQPFGEDNSGNLPTGEVFVVVNPDGNCLTSSTLGSRVSGPDCTDGPTISATNGIVTMLAPATVNFSFAALSPKQYGYVTFNIAWLATSNSPGAFSFSLGPGSVGCNVTPDGWVSITGAGTCIINAAQAAAGNYGASVNNLASFPIAPAQLQVTASSPTVPYGTSPTITPIYSGLLNGDTAGSIVNPPICQVAGTPPFGVGTYTTQCLPSGFSCIGLSCMANLSPNYTPTFTNGVLTVIKTGPVITWNAPAAINFGGALGNVQLNATANFPGTFTYNPPPGTVLLPGNGQVLTATFTPSQPGDVYSQTATTTINVNPVPSNAPPVRLIVTDSLARGPFIPFSNGNDLAVTLTVANAGSATAKNVLALAKIGSLTPQLALNGPAAIPSGKTATFTLYFSGYTAPPAGTSTVLSVAGVYTGGTFNSFLRVVLP
jgi:hypothetical protein